MASGSSGIAVVLNEELTIKLKEPKKKLENHVIASPVLRIHNHFDGNGWLCTKRGLCQQMTALYFSQGRDPFGATPLTFIVREDGTSDPEFPRFRQAFDALDSEAGQRTWLTKPGEWSNRGCGIKIFNDADEVAQRVDTKKKVWVIQKYIERPLLIHKRKFDIRAYCLVVQEPDGGPLRAFAFRDAYLRTTSAEYNLKDLDKMIHLNNDAVQKKGEDYGKFESANKLSLEEWHQCPFRRRR
jgi:tubulin--tyrosine ligase